MARSSKSKQPISNIYVTVDACAELGGQPYRVLEGLHQVYEVTGRRNLTAVDTVQGLREKSSFFKPEMMHLLEDRQSNFVSFMEDNADWVKVIETDVCKEFEQSLSEQVFPQMVYPMAELAESAISIIQQQAFMMMKSRGEHFLQGKHITSPDDIEIKIRHYTPERDRDAHELSASERSGHYIFTPKIVSEAAGHAFSFWKDCTQEDDSLSKRSKRQVNKGHMAMAIKALQESKAIAHTIFSDLAPELAEEMGPMPEAIARQLEETGQISLRMLRDHSHEYAAMQFPDGKQLGDRAELIQAVRFTSLWPWAHKGMLTEDSSLYLNKIHKDTADISYLNAFTNHLPELSEPQDSLYIVVSHDVPLRKQFLDASTGVHCAERFKGSGRKREQIRNFSESHIYESRNLQRREPEEYPHEAVWVGSEFVSFAYKEVVASLSPYIKNREVKQFSRMIRENGPTHPNEVGEALLNTILELGNLPKDLQDALQELTESTINLESYIQRDIEHHGIHKKEGGYFAAKVERLDMKETFSRGQ